MNHNPPHFRPRTALLIGALFVSTPALAQEGQTVTPPTVVPTMPQTEQVTPPAQPAAPAQTITPPRIVPTTVQAIPDTPEPQPEARTTTRSTQAARPAPRRVTTTTRTTAPAPAEPIAETPSPAAAPAPETAPVAEVPPATAPIQTPVDPAPVEVTTTTTTTEQGSPTWPWLVGGILLVLGGLAFLLYRRRREDAYAEEYYEEPIATTADAPVIAAPVAVVPVAKPAPRHEPEVAPRIAAVAPLAAAPVADIAPVAAEKADVSSTDEEDLAGIVDGTAPVSQRPWIELGVRPLRAGISADEALVEVELIVGNAGDMAAEDVRISTFMLPAGATSTEMEDLLIRGETAVPPLSIKAGEGKTVDATLAVAKAQLTETGTAFSPTVVADARYRLPDGSEGRTSAAFRIGLTDEDRPGIEAIELDNRGMHENVAAELEGVPERA